MPAYYATLALMLLVMAVIPGGSGSVGHWWSTMWPAFTLGVIVSHLLLVHNLSEFWVYKIDAPMWSIATEWQIYFLFPLILLPLFRRFGAVAAILGGTVIGPRRLLHAQAGMGLPGSSDYLRWGWGRYATTPGLREMPPWQKKMRWGWTCPLALALPLVAMILWGERLSIRDNWRFSFIADVLTGFCTASFIIWAAERSVKEHANSGIRHSLVLSLLSSNLAIGLGAFSYSLYLTHAPVEMLLEMLFSRLPLGPNVRALSFAIAAAVAATAFAYFFYRLFEKPFLRPPTARMNIFTANPNREIPASRPNRALWAALALAVAAVAVGVRFWIAQQSHAVGEDALITLRYAENIAAGNGFVYNMGQRVLGTTTPLYTLLLALFCRLHAVDAMSAGRGANILADGFTCFLIFRSLANPRIGHPGAGVLGSILYGFSPLAVDVSVSGMETGLVTCVGMLAIHAWLMRRPYLLFAAGAVLFLLRIDGLALLGILAACLAVRERRIPLARGRPRADPRAALAPVCRRLFPLGGAQFRDGEAGGLQQSGDAADVRNAVEQKP